MKRQFGAREIPAVEKLYRQNNPEIDLRAGGFDEDDDEYEKRRERISEAAKKKRDRAYEGMVADHCNDCAGPLFSDSFLWNHFNFAVCDKCRDEVEKHKLIARTEAKSLYLLKDCDLDLRKPPLRFIAKKNPHNPRYGDMKLYLKPQLEARALEIYGSLRKLEETRAQKEQLKEAASEKRFERKIHKMRKEIRGNSLKAAMQAGTSHEHTFGEEQFDERRRDFWKQCNQCEYEMRYEKL